MIKLGMITYDTSENNFNFDEESYEIIKMEPNAIGTCSEVFDGIIVCDGLNNLTAEIYNAIIQIKEKNLSSFIWVVSKKMSEMDRLVCLKLGISGIFQEDIHFSEIQLTIQNALSPRRIEPPLPYSNASLEEGKAEVEVYSIDENSRSIIFPSGYKIHLTELEHKLFMLLKNNCGAVITYETIFNHLWETKCTDLKTDFPIRIANIIHHLRTKINKSEVKRYFEIETIRSRGYVFVEKNS